MKSLNVKNVISRKKKKKECYFQREMILNELNGEINYRTCKSTKETYREDTMERKTSSKVTHKEVILNQQ